MKVQHLNTYRVLPALLKEMREQADMTQRDLAKALSKAQSYIYNCEVSNRRVDITEFVLWSKACGVDPKKAFNRLLKNLEG
jgi:transcriptional regulator with XRE-family HTH domain